MDSTFWIESWQDGRTGFHQDEIHASLEKFWPDLPADSSVLVPLCGKSLDMLWLAQQGLHVSAVELVEQAVLDFCHENGLAFSVSLDQERKCYRLLDRNIRLYVDDFFHFAKSYTGCRFDALFDRAALVALPATQRTGYVNACRQLLCSEPQGLLITLDYPQELMQGPPFSVAAAEVQRLWPGSLHCVDQSDVIDSLARARESGISRLLETTWRFQTVHTGQQ